MPDLRAARCVVYRRVSTEKQVNETLSSLDDQHRACELLAQRLGLAIDHVYTDDGYSGGTIEQRPAMQAMLADCAQAPRTAREQGFVLVLNDSRFGRFPDPEESAYWRFHLSRLGWLVRFAEHDDTDDLPTRGIMRAVSAGEATRKRQAVQANAKRGMRGSIDRGFWCSQAPFGFRRKVVYPVGRERILESGVRKAVDEKIVLAPHAEEAAIVVELFRKYSSGEHSLSSLVDWITEVAPGRLWKFSMVRNALSNPAYVGDIVFGRMPHDPQERKAGKRDRSQWYVKRSAHTPVVDRALFDRVQDLLERNRRTTKGVRSDWIVSGIVTCRCGVGLISGGGGRNGRKGGGTWEPCYRCATRNRRRPAQCKYRGTIAKSALEHAVMSAVAAEASTPAARARILKHLDAAIARARTSPADALDALRRERAAVSLKRDRLVDAIADGTLSRELARTRLEQLNAADDRLLAQIESAATQALNVEQARADRDRIAKMLANLPQLLARLQGPTLRELIRPWIHRAVFNTDTRVLTLEIKHFPLFHMESDSMGRHRKQQHSGVTRRRVRVTA
jgi:DNA invertase Pin-like site-specific DNA recombinase